MLMSFTEILPYYLVVFFTTFFVGGLVRWTLLETILLSLFWPGAFIFIAGSFIRGAFLHLLKPQK